MKLVAKGKEESGSTPDRPAGVYNSEEEAKAQLASKEYVGRIVH